MAVNPKTISIRNRELPQCLSALEKLLKNRAIPDRITYLYLGKSARNVRETREDVQAEYDLLVESFAKRDEDDKVVPGAQPGSVALDDQHEFFKQQRALDQQKVEVEVWPVRITKLESKKPRDKDKDKCPRCKQMVGMPDPEAFATLIDVGILIDDYPYPEEEEESEEDFSEKSNEEE